VGYTGAADLRARQVQLHAQQLFLLLVAEFQKQLKPKTLKRSSCRALERSRGLSQSVDNNGIRSLHSAIHAGLPSRVEQRRCFQFRESRTDQSGTSLRPG